MPSLIARWNCSCSSLILLCSFVCLAPTSIDAQEKRTIDFNRDIKPLLSDRCFQCHGPDENQRKADLRLDQQDSAASTFVAGNADESDLIDRITSEDSDLVMPPPDANKKKLSAAEIQLFRDWIDQGAEFDAHWAYKKPGRPEIPKLEKLHQWATEDIDHFVAKQLEAINQPPAEPADKRTLVRRLYFDLIGLPPSPQEVDAFVNSDDPKAYERLVDHLLAQPSFGERMAQFWLDQVRYADTNGIHGDNHRDHAPYRDYVIRAFNTNMPFDQFTLEQLAGDLLSDATNQQKIASGYNRLNMTTREGGAQAKEYRAKYAADRVRNASVVWMGSTFGCAECHDHKYDPFSMKDFYSFAAFFADIEETAVGQQRPIRLPDLEQEKELQQLNSDLEIATTEFRKWTPEREGLFRQFIADQQKVVKNLMPTWLEHQPTKMESSGGSTLVLENNIIRSTGESPDKDNYSLQFSSTLKTITGFRLEVLTDDSFPNQSVGRGNGNIVLTDIKARFDGNPVKIQSAIADFSQDSHDIKLAIDNKADTGWAVSGHTKKENRVAVFVFEKPIEVNADKFIQIEMKHESIYAKHNIGKFRISFTEQSKPSLDDHSEYPADLIALIQKSSDENSDSEKQRLRDFFLEKSETQKDPRDRVRSLKKRKEELEKAFSPILVSKSIKPREMRVLPRGNWLDDSGPIVQPSVPSFLGQIETVEDTRANRLNLARWIIDPQNPLTARVFVNRIWKITFGEGLVRTPDDFGSQGRVPTHPELLDYLAVEFVDSGWNTKELIKKIVMSNTYRQSSFASSEQIKEDPENLLLNRQNRFRLDAEFVRDNALKVSGLLVEQVGGTSVKPYQPAGYWEHLNFPRRTYQASKGADQYRRGLYSYWCRTFLHPSMSAFDAPSREESCVQRPRSNTPLQALVLLNDPSYVEAAQAFAEKIMKNGESPAERVQYAYSETVNRTPSQRENEILLSLYQQHLKKYKEEESTAENAVEVGVRKPAEELDAGELAAWTSVARTILNLHETITRY